MTSVQPLDDQQPRNARLYGDAGLGKDADYVEIEGLPDAEYGWVETRVGGASDRRLRLHNAAEVKAAAAWLLRHRDAFAYEDRMNIARRVLARERALGGGLVGDRDALDKVAAYGTCDPDVLVDAIFARQNLLRRAHAPQAAVDGLAKVAEDVSARPGLLNAARRVKLAGLLDALDREYSLTASYERDGLARPEDAVFAVTTKTAADFAGLVPLKNGCLFRLEKDAVAGVDLFALRDYVGEEFAAAVSDDGLTCDREKFAAAAAQLPRDEADVLTSYLGDVGVTPAHRIAPETPRLDRKALRALAASADA